MADPTNLNHPEEREHVYKQQNDDVPASSLKYLNPKRGQTMETARRANRISFWQLNALIVMVVLAARGLVSPLDLAFPASIRRPFKRPAGLQRRGHNGQNRPGFRRRVGPRPADSVYISRVFGRRPRRHQSGCPARVFTH
ncbi:hypothetical protein ACFX2B_041418 [Malus domestica]